MHYLILYIITLFLGSLFAQEELTINGLIIDSSNQKPLPGANIYIEDSDFGTVSNKSGAFSLSVDNLKKGEIKISMIGFKDTTLFVNLKNIKNK